MEVGDSRNQPPLLLSYLPSLRPPPPPTPFRPPFRVPCARCPIASVLPSSDNPLLIYCFEYPLPSPCSPPPNPFGSPKHPLPLCLLPLPIPCTPPLQQHIQLKRFAFPLSPQFLALACPFRLRCRQRFFFSPLTVMNAFCPRDSQTVCLMITPTQLHL